MNQNHLESWLFNQDELTLDQKAARLDHLHDCESCRILSEAWRQLEEQLSKSQTVIPEPGFTSRWRERVEVDRELSYQHQTLLILTLSFCGVVILLTGVGIFAWPWLRTPNLILWTVMYQLYTYFVFAQETGEFMLTVLDSFARITPTVFWIFLAGIISQLGVLWIVTYRLLTIPRSITK